MSRFVFLIIGVCAFVLSFFVPKFFIQFIVLAVFSMVLYILGESRHEIASFKKTLEEHNQLLKKAMDEEDTPSNLN